jgi:hypothetical protein
MYTAASSLRAWFHATNPAKLESQHRCLQLVETTVVALSAACGFALAELSQLGEPFGCKYGEPPFPAHEIIARGYSVIHSLKPDPNGRPQAALRTFFTSVREGEKRQRQASPPSPRPGSDLRDLTSRRGQTPHQGPVDANSMGSQVRSH